MAGEGDAERLVVLLEARIRDFEKNMAKASGTATSSYARMRRGSQSATQQMEADMLRSTSRINQALATTSTKVGALGKTMLAGFAGGLIAGGLAGIIGRLGDVASGVAAVGDEARRAGVDVEAFQELKFVADQNRIAVGALTDGLKELNLRADEFIVTGGGAAAEAFQRLGYSAEELNEKLADPTALFTEIIGKLGELDRAAAIRIADEIFGGTGGEQFVQLIDSGTDGIQRSIDKARELGVVLSAETVAKAAEVDRKFKEIADTVGSKLREAVVNVTDALIDLFDAMPATPEEGLAKMANEAFDLQYEITMLTARAAGAFPELVEQLGTVYEGIRSNTMEAEAAKVALLDMAQADPDFAPIAGDLNGLITLLSQVRGEAVAAAKAISLSKSDPATVQDFDFEDLQSFGKPKPRTTVPGSGAKPPTKAPVDHLAEGMERMREEGRQLAEDLRDPFSALNAELDHLGAMLNAKAIDWETFTLASNRAKVATIGNVLDMTSEVTSVLAGAFQDNKALAIADIGVSTAQGIMKALGTQGPLGWLQAAAIGAAGAAQLAAVMSASPGNASAAPVAPAAAAPSAAPMSSEQESRQTVINLEMRGGGRYSWQEVEAVIEAITEHVNDGGARRLVKLINNGGYR